MQTIVTAPTSIRATISLPASKSLSNRALVMNALAGGDASFLTNLADCDDTTYLIKALKNKGSLIDVGAAGTTMRFLTAYLSIQSGQWTLTGSDRMKNRPIGTLVDALRTLGATIQYTEKKGYPPLRINGNPLKGGIIQIDGSISSQYISALMMIGPLMADGLTLNIQGNLTSRPYTQMTLDMLTHFGIQSDWSGNTIRIPRQSYRKESFAVESDWSAASYWYEIISLVPDGSAFLKGLNKNSLQGDAKVAGYFTQLGVTTTFENEGVRLHKSQTSSSLFEADLTDQPDLAQTLVVTCALKRIPFRITGLKTLKIKETDRIAALIAEGRKIGCVFKEIAHSGLGWDNERCNPQPDTAIDTYDDHRMALSFAPVALANQTVRINHPEVVSKSYPNFWNDLQTAGFTLITQN